MLLYKPGNTKLIQAKTFLIQQENPAILKKNSEKVPVPHLQTAEMEN